MPEINIASGTITTTSKSFNTDNWGNQNFGIGNSLGVNNSIGATYTSASNLLVNSTN